MVRIVEPGFEILGDFSGSEMLKSIEAAGRISYKSEDKITEDSAPKFVKMILKRGHESVIEHESVSVRIVCDRGVSHEIVRHRIASYTQESTRFCNYSKGKFDGEITVIQPEFLSFNLIGEPSRNQINQWWDAMIQAERSYLNLIEMGAKPQLARSVLPNSLKTEIIITANLREWMHIFRLRTAKAAHPQMRQITIPLLREMQRRIPVIFDDIEVM